jgi:hypothetical protein
LARRAGTSLGREPARITRSDLTTDARQAEVGFVLLRAKLQRVAVGLLCFLESAEAEIHRGVVHVRLEELRVEATSRTEALHRGVEVSELDLNQPCSVVERAVVRVLANALPCHECREIQLLRVHVLLLRARGDQASALAALLTFGLCLAASR